MSTRGCLICRLRLKKLSRSNLDHQPPPFCVFFSGSRLKCWTNTCFWPPSRWFTSLTSQKKTTSAERTNGECSVGDERWESCHHFLLSPASNFFLFNPNLMFISGEKQVMWNARLCVWESVWRRDCVRPADLQFISHILYTLTSIWSSFHSAVWHFQVISNYVAMLPVMGSVSHNAKTQEL